MSVPSAPFVVLGDINADIRWHVPALPTLGTDTQADEHAWESGGTGVNAAVTYARLGAAVRLVGRVGDDPGGRVALRVPRSAGVDLDFVREDDTVATGLCATLVTTDGERSFLSSRGANRQVRPADAEGALVAGCPMLHLSAYALLGGPQRETAMALMERAEALGIPIAIDLALPPIDRIGTELLEMIPRFGLISLNADECAAWVIGLSPAEAASRIVERGAGIVAVKLGSRGCFVVRGEERVAVRPPAIVAVDSTGAGDAFTAGLAWALHQGYELSVAAAWANAMGAGVASARGAARAVPERAWAEAHVRELTADTAVELEETP